MMSKLLTLVVLTLFLFPSQSSARLNCKSLVQSAEGAWSFIAGRLSNFLDHSANRSHLFGSADNQVKTERARAKTVQLNRLLFPLLIELKSAATAMKQREIEDRVTELNHSSPIKSADFSSFRRRRESEIESDLFRKYMNNSREAIRFGVPDLPLAIKLDDFRYVEPDRDRIQSMGEFHNTLSSILTPVGFYGDRFAEDLLRTTQILAQLVEERLTDQSKNIYESHKDFFDHSMHRSMQIAKGRENGRPELSINSAMMEGILTFTQLVGLLLNGGLDGVENPKEALFAIVAEGSSNFGITASVTQLFPPGIVAPMAHAGLAFQNTLLKNEDGKWTLTPQLIDHLKFLRRTYEINTDTTAVGCPFASIYRRIRGEPDPSVSHPDDLRTPGLQLLAEAFYSVFAVVSEIPR